jgi:CO/xanthine dehydrogenase FAD-binding subunit
VRSPLDEFPVVRPTRLADALALLAAKPEAITPLAGATDLFVTLNAGALAPTTFLDLSALRELAPAPVVESERIVLGASTTYAAVRRDVVLRARLPLLELAAREVGALQIQNRATWAGNIENASPAADGVPVLMAYDGAVELTSVRGARWVELADYYVAYKQTVRAKDELITRWSVRPPAPEAAQTFRKVGTRKLQAISKVVFAGVIEREASAGGAVRRARLVLGSVAPVTLRLREAEGALEGHAPDEARRDEAMRAVASAIAPIDDVRSTEDYRRKVTLRIVRAFLDAASGARER